MGAVAAVYRYPVKSLRGEELEHAEVEARGLVGDRLWAVRDPDGKLGSGKSSRRFRQMDGLLDLRARYDGDTPVVAFPDGREHSGPGEAVERALSAHVGRPVRLAREGDVAHHDDGPVHLVTTASLRHLARALGEDVDVRRFRPNLLVDTPGLEGLVEDGWVGRELTVGEVRLRVVAPMPRCVMTTQAQGDLPADPRVLRTVTDLNDTDFGVLAEVLRPGRVQVGDPVSVT